MQMCKAKPLIFGCIQLRNVNVPPIPQDSQCPAGTFRYSICKGIEIALIMPSPSVKSKRDAPSDVDADYPKGKQKTHRGRRRRYINSLCISVTMFKSHISHRSVRVIALPTDTMDPSYLWDRLRERFLLTSQTYVDLPVLVIT